MPQPARLVFHAAIVLLLGLLCGFPALTETVAEGRLHTWRSAHLALVILGVWILATAAVWPVLVLGRREASALLASLLVTGYGIGIAVILEAATGVGGHQPEGPALNWIAFGGNTVGALAALLAVLLTAAGAWAARRQHPRS